MLLSKKNGIFSSNKWFVIICFSLLFLSACSNFHAYYNAYFNAEKAFKKAERLKEKRLRKNPLDSVNITADERALYYRSVEKGSKVLELYGEKKSKYLPKSLFLMAKAYVRMEDWAKAMRKFAELRKAYPNFEKKEEATYLEAIAFFHGTSYPIARRAMLNAMVEVKNPSYRSELMELFAELEKKNNGPEEGLKQYRQLLREGSLSPMMKGRILFECAELSFGLKKWSEARSDAQSTEITLLKIDKKFRAAYIASVSAHELNQKEVAHKEMESLIHVNIYDSISYPASLKLGEWLLLAGPADSGIRVLLAIPVLHPRTEQSSEAFFRVANYYLDQKLDRKKGMQYLDSSAATGSFPLAIRASEMVEALKKINKWQSDSVKVDSTWELPKEFLIAETFLFNLEKVDSCLFYLEKVLSRPLVDSIQDQKLKYAQAYIYGEYLKQKVKSDSLYQKIIQTYPISEVAKQAERNLGATGIVSTNEDRAKALFVEAEDSLFAGFDLSKTVFPRYQKVIDTYPKSEHAAKAQYVLAMLSEDRFKAGDSTAYVEAVRSYQLLLKGYASSAYFPLAEAKLTAIQVKVGDQKLPLLPPKGPLGDDWKVFYKVEEKKTEEPKYEYDEEMDSKEVLDPVIKEK